VVASILLPRRLRQPFYNVYAFCRTADDAADESESPEAALHKLDQLQSQLNDLYSGAPLQGLFLALSATVREFQLDQQPFDALLDAFRQDQRTTRYETFDQVLDYCQRSANPVGRIVLSLGQCLDEQNARLSDSICTGLQLANFLQDVAADYRRGRIYLAADQMSRFGVRDSMFSEKQTPRALRQLLTSECDRAEEFLRGGLPLSNRVPPWFAADVRLFAEGGLATLAAIRRIDYDVLRVRPTVSKLKQFALLLKASVNRF
jgi:squalene synthase HpnC